MYVCGNIGPSVPCFLESINSGRHSKTWRLTRFVHESCTLNMPVLVGDRELKEAVFQLHHLDHCFFGLPMQ